jgi:hypothetical protein
MRFSVLCLAFCVAFAPTPAVRADEKGDADEIKKVVEAYLKNQGSPTRCDDNLALCLENAVHLVFHKKDNKLDIPRTIKQQNGYIKKVLKDDQTITIDSVNVDVKKDAGLAVAFVKFKSDETTCHSTFVLALREGKWKIASVTQENR